MASEQVSDELWDEFHRVVNMTSRELTDWLMVVAADEDTERFLDEAGHETGLKVVGILGKRRTDVTDDDAAVNGATTSSPPRARTAGGAS